ncbi:MAG: hypothetical protein Q7R76_03120 [Candidatus Woesearchaeota archaeon]|nr:hypothetical protein [Candidatus Woesearchaeota archaeon]
MRLFFVWYSLVVVLLVSFLFEVLIHPTFSLLFFVRLFLVVAALIGSFFVVGAQQKKHTAHQTDYGRMKNGLLAELQKKNAEIKRLKDERQIFLNAAVKQATKTVEFSERLSKNHKP